MKRRHRQKSHQDSAFVEIYEDVENVSARKGSNSLWPNQPFKHKFKRGASVLGVRRGGSVKLRKGDLIIRSRNGKPLWKYFKYE